MPALTRRQLITQSAALAAAASAGMLGSRQTSAQAPGVRKNVSSLNRTSPEIRTLITAVNALKKLPSSDRRRWQALAQVHRDHCPHSNWFFLPWHRAFLWSFESICREVAGQPDFMLPYWNWTADPQLPSIFWDEPALGDSTRKISRNDTASDEYVGGASIANVLDTSDFETFGSARADCGGSMAQLADCGTGMIEGIPHNYIHTWISGDMVTALSPLDPIFWLHHANVDRLWTVWNERYPNPRDAGWLGHVFQRNFSDARGNPIDVAVKDVLSTDALGYRYDTFRGPQQTSSAPSPQILKLSEAVNTRDARGLLPLSVSMDTPQLRQTLERVAAGSVPPATTVRVSLDNLIPSPRAAGVRVFLNCDYLSATTPTNDPHYVGSVAFFHGGGENHDSMRTSFLLNVASTLRRLQRVQRLESNRPLRVQLLNTPLRQDTPITDASVSPTRVSVATIGSV